MRYVLVPMTGAVAIATLTPPAPDGRSDLIASFVSQSDSGIVLGFPTYDPNTVQAPAETSLYLVAGGQPVPADGQGFADSAYPRSLVTDPVPVEGTAAYPVPFPAAPGGNYNWYAVHGFAE